MPDATEVSPALAELARAHRVATSYEDWAGEQVAVSPATVTTVLAGLGVDASTPERIAEALAERAEAPWRRLLPPTVVVRGDGDAGEVVVHAPAGVPVALTVEREGGGEVSAGAGVEGARRTVDGAERVAVTFRLPDLPYGWHRLTATAGDDTGGAVLVVAPTRVERSAVERTWGWMVQLYSVRSADDWGLGDYADLAELARRATGHSSSSAASLAVHAMSRSIRSGSGSGRSASTRARSSGSAAAYSGVASTRRYSGLRNRRLDG
jgi:4-alpha-glucanotransferase